VFTLISHSHLAPVSGHDYVVRGASQLRLLRLERRGVDGGVHDGRSFYNRSRSFSLDLNSEFNNPFQYGLKNNK
jgi:hypothetical protein